MAGYQSSYVPAEENNDNAEHTTSFAIKKVIMVELINEITEI